MVDKNSEVWVELKLLQDSTMKIWQIYISWFTWSLGLNLLSLGLVVSKEIVRKEVLGGLAIIMIVSLILSIAAGFLHRAHYLETLKRAGELARVLGGDNQNVNLIFGGKVGRYASIAIPITHFAALIGWIVLAYKVIFEGFPS
jgi:hypothetical protein